jgi:hypothetical protein
MIRSILHPDVNEIEIVPTGTAYPSGAPEFTPVFSGVRVTRSLVLYVCFVGLNIFYWYN